VKSQGKLGCWWLETVRLHHLPPLTTIKPLNGINGCHFGVAINSIHFMGFPSPYWTLPATQQVDPDCVFFPARLRGHVHSYVGQNVFFLKLGRVLLGLAWAHTRTFPFFFNSSLGGCDGLWWLAIKFWGRPGYWCLMFIDFSVQCFIWIMMNSRDLSDENSGVSDTI
jgi:hypothetical protein